MKGRLTAVFVDRAKAGMLPPGRYRDGAGLILAVGERGASWVLRYQLDGRRRDLGLGSVQLLGLARARDLARQHRVNIRIHRIDPVAQRRTRSSAITFGQAAKAYIETQAAGWRDPNAVRTWTNSFANHAGTLMGRRVDEITVDDVLGVLRPIWAGKTTTAANLRARIEKVLGYAKATGHRQGANPAAWRENLDALLPKVRSVKPDVEHYEAVPVADLPAAYKRLAASDDLAATLARLTLLTAVRPAEARNAERREIDLAAEQWTIPGHRMKKGKLHVVPLSDQAFALVRGLPAVGSRLFPDVLKPDHALKALRQASGLPTVTLHGSARASFTGWATKAGYDDRLVDYSLAHYPTGLTAQAYWREALVEERRSLMQAWAKFLHG